MTDGCKLCDLPADKGVVDSDGNRFCCRGCRDVYDALGEVDDVDATDVRERIEEEPTAPDPDDSTESTAPEGQETTFLEVRGMHCASCEAFIESAAAATDGVSDASASYVTETVRVDHDPDEISETQLCEAVSGLGYSAFDREDAFSRRQANHADDVRLAVGVLVGMAVMLQYITIIYPTYFDGLFYDERTAAFLADAMAHTSGTFFFILIAVLTTIILLVTGKPILQGAYVAVRTRSPNMDLLVAIAAVSAYLYSHVAVVFVDSPHVYYDVTVAIIVVVTVGNHHEAGLKRRATDRLSELASVRVENTRRIDEDGSHETVDVDELEAGDRLVVRAGERVPVDGEILEGEAAVDESVITGESLPVSVGEGDHVVGGSIVTDGAVTVEVGEGAGSTLDRIAELVWDLQSSAHGIQGLADRLATVFVPVVLATAVVVTAVYIGIGVGIAGALLVGLTVLIVSCPCALGLATPLAVAAGIRDSLREGIVVFDGTVFERIRGTDTVVFDKTGTLTTGEMEVLEADVPADLLADAAAVERRSAHPIAKAIAALAEAPHGGTDDVAADGGSLETESGGKTEPPGRSDAEADVDSFRTHDRGVSGVVDGREVVVGHPELFAERGWELPEEIATTASEARDVGRVPVVVGRDGSAEGLFVVGDELREEWEQTCASLSDRGVEVVVLTGDDERAATVFEDHEAVDRVFAGVPPEGKAATIDRLADRGETVMVGDGTNDAPALASADLGIALGGGTAMAADAADVAIVDDDLRGVQKTFDLANAAGTRVKQNVGWAFCYNGIAIPLAVTGLLNPLFAAVAMATSSLLVVGNSSRSLLDTTE